MDAHPGLPAHSSAYHPDLHVSDAVLSIPGWRRLGPADSVVVDRFFGATGTRLGPQVLTAVRATVNGLVLVGFGEGLLLGVAYAISGLPRPVLLGALTGVLATVPFGAPVIFGLGALVLFSQSQTGAAVALLVFGFVVVFVADHFLRPILIGGAARLPFLWVLLGIFGGLSRSGCSACFWVPPSWRCCWRCGANGRNRRSRPRARRNFTSASTFRVHFFCLSAFFFFFFFARSTPIDTAAQRSSGGRQ